MATQSASPSSLGSMPGASGEALIKMEGIKKIFYTDEVETHALSDIHLEIRPGEYIAINGPSGCGKTTLLSILGLLDIETQVYDAKLDVFTGCRRSSD